MRAPMQTLTRLLACSLLAACATEKAPVDDDFSALTGMDEKSDAFSTHMKIAGSLDFGQTSVSTKYTKSPKYRAFKFAGNQGDAVDVWVRSTQGDAVAWLLDNNFKTLATNDDADSTTLDAHLVATLPASASATHYIVFRDYNLATHYFTVALAGGGALDACSVDADCVAVPFGGCCPDGTLAAVNSSEVDAYAAAHACATPPGLCPQHEVLETRVAQCNNGTKRCEMIQPGDIKCGGFIMNAHHCPDAFTCMLNHIPDVPGTCVAN